MGENPQSDSPSPSEGKASSPSLAATTRRLNKEAKLGRLLEVAAALMARQGYSQTTIRDVSRETGYSLAGMYYYFQSKEELLYLIQFRTFGTLLEQQEASVAEGGTAIERLRRLVRGHLSYFDSHPNEMKVCTYELDSLAGDLYARTEEIRRRYYHLTSEIVGEIMGHATDGPVTDLDVRHNTLFLFGALNWVFMWFDREVDGEVDDLVDKVMTMFLDGIRGADR